MKKLLFFFAVIIPFNFIHSQNEDWKFSGQVQLRSEVDGRDFKHRTHPLTFASLRTRVGVEKTFLDKINFFVQIQDSRVFGEEGNTLASIDNLDLHQGYITLKKLFDWNMDVQAGRFEVAYGTERFLGAVGWHYVARSWDGVRFKFYPGFKLDLFALTHTESVPYIPAPNPQVYSSVEKPSYSVYGFWLSENFFQQHEIDLFAYYEINRTKINNSFAIDHTTIGINHTGSYSNLSTIFEAAYQPGSLVGSNVSAYLLSLQGNYNFNSANLGLGADIISGTEANSGDVNTFAPRFGTNHKFYGYMDYFINFAGQYLSLGLNDFYLMANYNFSPDVSLSINFHHFTSNKSYSDNEDDYMNYGQEFDFTLKYNFIKGTTISWGGSFFIPDDLMKFIFSTQSEMADDPGFWSYLMITANL